KVGRGIENPRNRREIDLVNVTGEAVIGTAGVLAADRAAIGVRSAPQTGIAAGHGSIDIQLRESSLADEGDVVPGCPDAGCADSAVELAHTSDKPAIFVVGRSVVEDLPVTAMAMGHDETQT